MGKEAYATSETQEKTDESSCEIKRIKKRDCRLLGVLVNTMMFIPFVCCLLIVSKHRRTFSCYRLWNLIWYPQRHF